MSGLSSLGFILLVACIILMIVGSHYVVNNDSVDKDNKLSSNMIYILTGVLSVLLILGYIVVISKK